MSEDRVRQLISWQLHQIEVRNQRLQQIHEQHEQESYMPHWERDSRKYQDENEVYGRLSGRSTPSYYRSPGWKVAHDHSRHIFNYDSGIRSPSLSTNGDGYANSRNSLPDLDFSRRQLVDFNEMMYGSMPVGLHAVPPGEQQRNYSECGFEKGGHYDDRAEKPRKYPEPDIKLKTSVKVYQNPDNHDSDINEENKENLKKELEPDRLSSGHNDSIQSSNENENSSRKYSKGGNPPNMDSDDVSFYHYGSAPALGPGSQSPWSPGYMSASSPWLHEPMSPPPYERRPFSPALSGVAPLSGWSSLSSLSLGRQSSKIEEEVKTEEKKAEVLATQKAFNDNCCMRCFSRFVFIFNQKVQCLQCKYYICKNCSQYNKEFKEYNCHVCLKQNELKTQTADWFYESVKDKFKRFGSAKVVRSLYKRRTDSDSDAESSYISRPLYGSEPVGKRSRQGLEGLFAADHERPLHTTGSPGSEVVEEVVAAEEASPISRTFSTPYSCSVATGRETFEQVKDTELRMFDNQMDSIIRDLHQSLDSQTPLTPKQQSDLLSEKKRHLLAAISNLTQSLHIAVDNQDPSDVPESSMARHQLVQQILTNKVQDVAAKPLHLSSFHTDNDDIREEELADCLLNKILEDYDARTQEQAKREESDVFRAFTKLSNRATIEQLKDNYISESETDDLLSSHVDFTSDAESRVSDLNDFALTRDIPIGGGEVLGVTSSEDQVDNTRTFPGKGSPRDSDSGVVSSPNTEHTSSSKQDFSGDDSDEHTPSRRSKVKSDDNKNFSDKELVYNDKFNNNNNQSRGVFQNQNLDQAPVSNNQDDQYSSSNSDVSLLESTDCDSDMRDNILRTERVPNGTAVANGGSDWGLVSRRTASPNGSSDWGLVSQRSLSPRSPRSSVDGTEVKDPVKRHLINREWDLVESKPSHLVIRDQDHLQLAQRYSTTSNATEATLVNVSYQNLSSPVFADKSDVLHSTPQSELSDIKQQLSTSQSIPIRRQIREEDITSDSDITLEGSPSSSPEGSPVIEPRIHKTQVVRETLEPEFLHEGSFEASPSPEHDRSHVPLPSFLDSSRLDFERGDLDDIGSRHGDDGEDNMSTFSTEISFGRSWNFSGTESIFKDRGIISAYDNFGEKKVGLDGEGPVIMLVPNTDEDTGIKVGDKDVDDLSDLSENRSGSEDELFSDSENEDNISHVHAAMKQVLKSSSGRRSSDPDFSAPLVRSRKIKEPLSVEVKSVVVEKSPELSVQDRLLALAPVSTEGEETDPKFKVRPADVTVTEGELAKFTCEVTGTEPLDVFWYKAGTSDVISLNDDESCDAYCDGATYHLDMYNPTIKDKGPILCIGVNENGRCTQGFKLIVKENHNERKQPEFIKPLQDVEIRVGSKVKLRCKLSGYPQPRVLWYKDGKRITSSDHCKLEKYGNRDYGLVLEYATLEDDAEYAIVARNIAGEARSTAQLVVEDGTADYKWSTSLSASGTTTPTSFTTQSSVTTTPLVVTREISDPGNIYPDTEDLLRLAEQVSQTRGDVTTTASKMLRSAGQMSTLHQQLDDMDRKLDSLEYEVKDADQVVMETEAYKEIYRDEILKEEEELQTSASAVRHVTSTALDILSSANDAIQSAKDAQGVKRKSELLSPTSSNENEELCELKLSYEDFERLFLARKITRDQINAGMVPRSVYNSIQEYLQNEAAQGQGHLDKSHDLVVDGVPTSIDCGLKRVDSKRYKRDYVVIRDSPQVSRKWNVSMSPPSSEELEVVKSTPAGAREDAHEKINEAQEQIYLAAGRVSSLHSQISQLEEHVRDGDESNMAALEEEVARAAAQVKSSDRKVSVVENQVRTLEKSFPEKQIIRQTSSQSQKPAAPIITEPVAPSAVKPKKDISPPVVIHQEVKVQLSPVKPSPQITLTPPRQEAVSKPKPESIDLHGESSEDLIPESRTEFDADVSLLPSVRNLMSKFNQNQHKEDETHGSNFKRVYSLTGRDLPQTIREKLKKQGPAKTANPNIRGDGLPQEGRRSTLSGVFDSDPEMHGTSEPRSSTPLNGPLSPPESVTSPQNTSSSAGSTGSPHNRSSVSLTLNLTRDTPEKAPNQADLSPKSPVKSSVNAQVKAGTTWTQVTRNPQGPVSQQVPTNQPKNPKAPVRQVSNTPPSPVKTQPQQEARVQHAPLRQARSTPTSPVKSTAPTQPQKLPKQPAERRKSSTILARAAFWDTRINQGAASDKDAHPEAFPEMPEENFKNVTL